MTGHRPRTAVVTGGAGFIGTHLCTRLAADGVQVLCIDDLSTAREDAVTRLVAAGVTVARRSVTAPLHVDEPVDAVFHLACPASPVDYRRLSLETLDAGALGTRNALALARRHGARFLLASTSEVYGDPAVHPQTEDYRGDVDPVGPRSMYDEAKRFAEAYTVAYGRRHGTHAVIARIFNTYGPGMRADDGRMVPTFLAQARAGAPPTVHGDGTQTRSLCFVDDTVAGLRALIAHDDPGPVNIGNPEEVTVREVAERICRLLGRAPEPEFTPADPGDPRRRRPDITRARRLLGWRPTVDLDSGLHRTIAAEARAAAPAV